MLQYFIIGLALVLCAGAEDCTPDSCPSVGIKLISIPSECSRYISCLDGVATYRYCKDGESFDNVVHTCLRSSVAICGGCVIGEESEENHKHAPQRNKLPSYVPQQHWARANISQRCIDNSVTPVTCPADIGDDRLMPHPDDCRLFYVCETIGLPPVCRDCPANLHFNPVKKVCDHPEVAGCRSLLLPIPTEAPVLPKSDIIEKIEAYKSKKYEQCQQQNSIYADLRPDPKNCSKYYACDSGFLIPMDCPQGLHFNARLKVCDYPQSARCQLDNSSQINPQNQAQEHHIIPKSSGQCTQTNWPYADLRPDPEDCSRYYVCDWNVLISMPCPAGLHFSTWMKVCDLPQNARCQPQNSTQNNTITPVNSVSVDQKASQCVQNNGPYADLRPDPNNCTKYYVCDAGYLISMPCPAGLHFNAMLKVCDYPQNARCEIANTTERTTSSASPALLKIQPKEGPSECVQSNDVFADLRPDPENCSKYYVCDRGYLISMSCPEGLHFSTLFKICDLPQNARCQQASTIKEIKKIISKLKSSKVAVKPRSEVAQCEKNNGVEADLRPDPSDCSKYLVCDWGVLIPMTCPQGLHFNANLKVCDSPNTAKCSLFGPTQSLKDQLNGSIDKSDVSSESKEDDSDSKERSWYKTLKI